MKTSKNGVPILTSWDVIEDSKFTTLTRLNRRLLEWSEARRCVNCELSRIIIPENPRMIYCSRTNRNEVENFSCAAFTKRGSEVK